MRSGRPGINRLTDGARRLHDRLLLLLLLITRQAPLGLRTYHPSDALRAVFVCARKRRLRVPESSDEAADRTLFCSASRRAFGVVYNAMASTGRPDHINDAAPTVADYDPTRLDDILALPTGHQGEQFPDRCETFPAGTVGPTDPTEVMRMESHGGALNRHSDSTATSMTLQQNTPYVDHRHNAFITEEGKEAAEEPAGYETKRKYSSSESSDERVGAFDPVQAETLRRIATQTRQSFATQRSQSRSAADAGDLEKKGTLDGLGLEDEVFDPKSEKFDLYKWTKKILQLMNAEDLKLKRAGIVFKNLNVSGSGAALNLQKNVGSMFMAPLRPETYNFKKTPRHILHNFNGIMKSGELLIVLGRPGSGCSTLLKSMTGQLYGLHLDDGSDITYNGIPREQMVKEFKGELIYNQEVDKHFPHLTVGETLEHAAALRMPQARPLGQSRKDAVKHMTQVIMAVFGLSHTYNTKVG